MQLEINNNQTRDLKINAYSGRTPVILVPGILESTLRGTYSNYPQLETRYPVPAYKLVIHDPDVKVENVIPVGRARPWESLREYLKSQGYQDGDIFDAPYDWRMPIEDVAQHYLTDVIDQAKAATGSPQVDIVAHSTGGLAARAYIQSAGYLGDVRKFAMVGTPNEGASNMYYVWGGGAPKLADDVNETIQELNGWFNFYFNSIKDLYDEYHSLSELDPDDHLKTWEFLHSEGYGPKRLGGEGRQLLPTFPCIKYTSWGTLTVSKLTSDSLDGNRNDWLQILNNDANVHRMSRRRRLWHSGNKSILQRVRRHG